MTATFRRFVGMDTTESFPGLVVQQVRSLLDHELGRNVVDPHDLGTPVDDKNPELKGVQDQTKVYSVAVRGLGIRHVLSPSVDGEGRGSPLNALIP